MLDDFSTYPTCADRDPHAARGRDVRRAGPWIPSCGAVRRAGLRGVDRCSCRFEGWCIRAGVALALRAKETAASAARGLPRRHCLAARCSLRATDPFAVGLESAPFATVLSSSRAATPPHLPTPSYAPGRSACHRAPAFASRGRLGQHAAPRLPQGVSFDRKPAFARIARRCTFTH